MIKLENLHKTFTNPKGQEINALRQVNLQVQQGEIFGVVGKSGAGKSTLLRCVNLLEKPNQGKVFVDEAELTALPQNLLRQQRHQIAMIFQHFNLLNCRNVYDNIALPLQLVKKSKQEIERTIKPLLELTELSDKIHSYPSQLSGGQKQRVAIARALANKPKVLLCDEATSALDPQTTKSILKLLQNINKTLGLTILLITHEMEVIKEICDGVALIDDGEIIENATVIDFFTKPNSDIAKHLVQGCIRQELPEELKQKITSQKLANSHPIWRIYFYGASTSDPLIAHLIKNIGIDINILQANVEVIKSETLGMMTVEAIGTDDKRQQAFDYLQAKNVQVEVVGYVRSND